MPSRAQTGRNTLTGLGRALIVVGVATSVALILCWGVHLVVRESIGVAMYCGFLFVAGFGLAGYVIPVRSMPRPFFVGLLALVIALAALVVLSPLIEALGGPMNASGWFVLSSWLYLIPGIIGLAAGHRRLL